MPNVKKHKITRLLAEKINGKPLAECKTPPQKKKWWQSYATAVNALTELERMADNGLITFTYQPSEKTTNQR